MKKYIVLTPIFLLLFLFSSCNQRNLGDDTPEDYHKLFPVKDGLPKTKINYEEMNVSLCNTEVTLQNYKYLGVEMPKESRIDYTVTLKYQYTETDFFNPNPNAAPDSAFEILYIDDAGQLKILSSHGSGNGTPKIENKKAYEISFRVKSGYPLYLGVRGSGANTFRLKTSVTAKSDDGLVVSPVLAYEKGYSRDGHFFLESYCNTVILP